MVSESGFMCLPPTPCTQGGHSSRLLNTTSATLHCDSGCLTLLRPKPVFASRPDAKSQHNITPTNSPQALVDDAKVFKC